MKIIFFLLLSVSGILAKDKHFDYFVYTQQWPAAVCIAAQSSHHQCVIPEKVNGWVIHGLWPSRTTNKMGPFFCNNSNPFDEDKIKTIEDKLRLYWPNLFYDSPDLSFWKHEWKKHGTCSLSDKLTPNEFSYFNTALNLYQKYNITSILGKSGIIPNKYTTYKRNDFCNAVIKALNIVPVVTCIYDRKSRHHYIQQIEICVDKDLKAIDCPMSHHLADEDEDENDDDATLVYKKHKQEPSCAKCPGSKGIWYPPLTHDRIIG